VFLATSACSEGCISTTTKGFFGVQVGIETGLVFGLHSFQYAERLKSEAISDWIGDDIQLITN
jgi:hypothetical protein